MIVVDWATLLKMRGQPEQWDIFVTHHGFVPDPILITFLNDSYPGWWNSPEKAKLESGVHRHRRSGASARRLGTRSRRLFYEQVPAMKVGDAYSYDIASPKTEGDGRLDVLWPHFWNVSFN